MRQEKKIRYMAIFMVVIMLGVAVTVAALWIAENI